MAWWPEACLVGVVLTTHSSMIRQSVMFSQSHKLCSVQSALIGQLVCKHGRCWASRAPSSALIKSIRMLLQLFVKAHADCCSYVTDDLAWTPILPKPGLVSAPAATNAEHNKHLLLVLTNIIIVNV